MASRERASTADNPCVADHSLWGRVRYLGRMLARDRGGLIGLIMFVTVLLAAVFAPFITRFDPLEQDLANNKLPPALQKGGSWDHPLGTDNLGRDMYSRVIYGTRVSITVSFIGVLIALMLGLSLGAIAGYIGGRVDVLIMSPVNLVLALPYLLVVVFFATIYGRSLINIILIFGITDAPIFARLVRGEVLRMREMPYVESAICAGARWWRIVFDHLAPNLVGPIITLATFEMSAMIFYEAGLGFLGLSVPPTVPSWGNMLAAGRQYLTNYPWLTTFPGLAIMFTAVGMNLLGDWLRDVLDPRLSRSRR